jgi:hypothetical protein
MVVDNQRIQTGETSGTPWYLFPEQANGHRQGG